jgi:hypothetical protein
VPELLKEYHQQNQTIICSVHIYTSKQNEKMTIQPPTSTYTPFSLTQSSTSVPMANIKQDYKEQHQLKDEQYQVVTGLENARRL